MKKEMKLVNNKGFCFSRKKTKKRGFASERKKVRKGGFSQSICMVLKFLYT
ncbi:hypothetical protein ES332_D12G084100v1 [Gossypium tomentosum]|uniref:Uncharacterized protein n=1 Tax=Gossypium tomentosum TaxID=34277 RepID=A0A5D2I664_GOSTO|nr:hypothetical protein ES332_D12G084100v1 [Gossypium tomentosum]